MKKSWIILSLLMVSIILSLSGCSKKENNIENTEVTEEPKNNNYTKTIKTNVREEVETTLSEMDMLKEENTEEFKTIQDNYLIKKIYTVNDGDLIDTTSRFWVKATNDAGAEVFLCTDIFGNVWSENENLSGYNPAIMLTDELTLFFNYIDMYYIIVDLEGNDRTYDYIKEGECITCVANEPNRLVIVSVKEENTYSKQNLVYTFYDVNGSTLLSFDRISIEDKTGIEWTGQTRKLKSVRYLGGSMYSVNEIVLGYALFINSNSGETIVCDIETTNNGVESMIADEDNTIIYKPMCTTKVLDNKTGDLREVWYGVDGKGYSPCTDLNNGLFCGRREESIGFYKYQIFNVNGDIAVNLDYPDTRVKGKVKFQNGYGLLYLQNDARVPFVTIMNMKGEWMFDPIQGMPIRGANFEQGYCKGIDAYLIQPDEKTPEAYVLNKDGQITSIQLPFTTKSEEDKYQLDVDDLFFSYMENKLYCFYIFDNSLQKIEIN
mgnify:CR=1 FL=1